MNNSVRLKKAWGVSRVLTATFCWVLLGALAASCGNDGAVQTSGGPATGTPTTPTGEGDWTPRANPESPELTLVLFGAPWCGVCKDLYPEIQKQLNQIPEEQRSKLAVETYVTSGGNPAEDPTEEIAAAYQVKLKLDGASTIDRWKKRDSRFRRYVGRDLNLPGGAVLDKNGNVLRSYRAGATSFVAAEVVGFIKQELP